MLYYKLHYIISSLSFVFWQLQNHTMIKIHYIMSNPIISNLFKSCHITSHHIILNHIISNHIKKYYIKSNHNIYIIWNAMKWYDIILNQIKSNHILSNDISCEIISNRFTRFRYVCMHICICIYISVYVCMYTDIYIYTIYLNV